jgi:hypothetical protein
MACLSFHYKIRFAFWACLPSKNMLLEGCRNFIFRSSLLLLRLPTRQLQTSPVLPAAQAADIRRQSGIFESVFLALQALKRLKRHNFMQKCISHWSPPFHQQFLQKSLPFETHTPPYRELW